MKRILIAFSSVSFLFACNNAEKPASKTDDNTVVASTSESKSAEAWVPVDSATAMKSMMEAGTPGDAHAMLAKADGKWTAEATMWMAPGAPAEKSTGTAVNKMIYGGRYQQTTFKANMMGMPYEGSGTTGYDNSKKVYFSTWMDNMSTALMNMEGTWDEASRSISFRGKMICPANGKECEMRQVFKFIDDNNHIMEMYGPDLQTGKEYKSMEIKYKRG